MIMIIVRFYFEFTKIFFILFYITYDKLKKNFSTPEFTLCFRLRKLQHCALQAETHIENDWLTPVIVYLLFTKATFELRPSLCVLTTMTWSYAWPPNSRNKCLESSTL